MRGAVLRSVGKPLVISDRLVLASPGPGEVRVALRASGVCHSDLSMQNGTLAPEAMPTTLGHEGAGVVLETGPGVESVQPGDHVILVWIPPCGSCRVCLRGQPQLCDRVWKQRAQAPSPLSDAQGEIGIGFGIGTFAEETIVPAEALVVIDETVPFEIAALIGCGVMTGVGAVINTARVEPGSKVAVIGVGGVGVNVIQGARLSGASTIAAIDLNEGKLEAALEFGATHTATPARANALSEVLTGNEGFDYVFEVVGRSSAIRQAWDLTRRGGTTVVVGVGRDDDFLKLSAGEIYESERRLVGSIYGSADVRTDFHRVIALWRAGRLNLEGLISRVIGLDEVNKAFEAMADGGVLRSVITYS
jgi:S-(hydroxymethyl)glutathione dehydrogenase/alcohol dehydrogenase